MVLETRSVASEAMKNGFVVICESRKEAKQAINQLAPEHLEVQVRDLDEAISGLNHYGALFKGEQAAEVLGDYGAGPNHVLPTSGASRFTGGLSVLNFLRMRTWMQIENAAAAQDLVQDAEDLAHHEGLRAHAASASKRKKSAPLSSFVSPITINDVIDAAATNPFLYSAHTGQEISTAQRNRRARHSSICEARQSFAYQRIQGSKWFVFDRESNH